MSVPALVYNSQQDLISSNLLGRAMFAPLFEAEQPNMARVIFLDSRARDFYGDWDLACSLTAAMLRYEVGRNPLSGELTALVGELSTRSPKFRQSWSERDVHEHRTGHKIFHHPKVGELNVTYDVLELPGEPGLSITTADGATLRVYDPELGETTVESRADIHRVFAVGDEPEAIGRIIAWTSENYGRSAGILVSLDPRTYRESACSYTSDDSKEALLEALRRSAVVDPATIKIYIVPLRSD